MKKEIRFKYEKETKNCVRYAEDTKEAPIVGTLYVHKYALSSPVPTALVVTITEEK